MEGIRSRVRTRNKVSIETDQGSMVMYVSFEIVLAMGIAR